MAYGLQVRNAAGLLTVDSAFRLGRILGVMRDVAPTYMEQDATYYRASSGSVYDAGFATGRPVWLFQNTWGFSLYGTPPTITFSDNTLSWYIAPQRKDGSTASQMGSIIYGVC